MIKYFFMTYTKKRGAGGLVICDVVGIQFKLGESKI